MVLGFCVVFVGEFCGFLWVLGVLGVRFGVWGCWGLGVRVWGLVQGTSFQGITNLNLGSEESKNPRSVSLGFLLP